MNPLRFCRNRPYSPAPQNRDATALHYMTKADNKRLKAKPLNRLEKLAPGAFVLRAHRLGRLDLRRVRAADRGCCGRRYRIEQRQALDIVEGRLRAFDQDDR